MALQDSKHKPPESLSNYELQQEKSKAIDDLASFISGYSWSGKILREKILNSINLISWEKNNQDILNE